MLLGRYFDSPVFLTGNTMTMSSPTKCMSMFPQTTPSVTPSSCSIMITQPQVTLDTSKLTNSSPQNSDGWISHNMCGSMSRAALHASRTSQTHTPLSLCSPWSSPTSYTPSNRSLVTSLPTSPSPLASILCWLWSTTALWRGYSGSKNCLHVCLFCIKSS